jgi:2-desacetyl-2-hydroxyethyl bacteriochlorophyllide A dehydrogenase
MKAFVKVRPEIGGVEYMDFESPRRQKGEVIIEVKAAGICGTDLHLYDWAENVIREYKPNLPVVMGHEFAGRIADSGSEIDNLSVGDNVTAFPVLYCGHCSYCRDGQQNICNNRPIMGLGANGAFAQYVAIRAANVYRLDENIPFELGALSELTCVGIHALDRIQMKYGDTVAVVGCGPLGLLMAILSKHAGAGRVFVTGLKHDQQRLELAEMVGAHSIQIDEIDPKEVIFESTHDAGADVVFETAGSSAGVIQSIDIVRKGGRVSILGQGHEATQIQTATLSFREIELVGTRAYTGKDWDKVSTTLLNAAADLRHVVTHQIPLAQAEEGIMQMKSREGLKIVLKP